MNFRSFFKCLIFSLPLFSLASCSDEPEEEVVFEQKITSTGMFIVNAGQYASRIEGSLSYIDFEDNNVKQKLFYAANGQSLGATPQDAVIHGSKMYIAIYESNIIQVVDATTLKLIKQVRPEDGKGSPRDIIAKDGYVYVSMFEGYVARLDTLKLEFDASVKVGDNPEEICIRDNNLYVCNSGFGQGETLSEINLGNFTKTKDIKIGLNPTRIGTDGENLFVICMGNYYDIQASAKCVDKTGNVSYVADATLLAVDDNKLYLVNSPFFSSPKDFTYKIYNTKNLKEAPVDMVSKGVFCPEVIGVDPLTKHIFITSFYEGDYEGFANFTSDGYVNEYDENGNFIREYTTGVDPCALIFNKKTEWNIVPR